MLFHPLGEFGDVVVEVIQHYSLLIFDHVGDWIDGHVIHHQNDPNFLAPAPSSADFQCHPLSPDGLRSQKHKDFTGLFDLFPDFFRNVVATVDVTIITEGSSTCGFDFFAEHFGEPFIRRRMADET